MSLPLVPMLICLVLAISTIREVNGSEDEDEDYRETNSCLPQLADRCFRDVMPNLECHLDNNGACAKEFCSVVSDALRCAADIIDTDCKPDEGQANFDEWMKGLLAVQQKICANNNELFTEFLKSPCFNSRQFLDCLEEMTRVTHVVDLLNVILSKDQCNWLLVALPTCNVRANAAHSSCYVSQSVINTVIYTFFSHTECGRNCTKTSQAPVTCFHTGLLVFLSALQIFPTLIVQ